MRQESLIGLDQLLAAEAALGRVAIGVKRIADS